MRILLICDKNGETSFGRLAIDFHRALQESEGIQSQLLWLKTDRYFSRSEEEVEGITLRSASLGCGWFSFRRPLAALLKKKSFDAVILIRPELGFLLSTIRRAQPEAQIIPMIHDLFAETFYPRSLKFWLINRLFIRGTERGDAFLYNSEVTRAEASVWFEIADRPSAVIGCSIDSKRFHSSLQPPSAQERRIFRSTHGLRDFSVFVIAVSLDEPRKNLDTFLEMAARHPRIAFLRIGRPSERLTVAADNRSLTNFFQRGPLPAPLLRDYYRYADLLVSPSFSEGFGMTPLEALASGTDVVCSRIPVHVENLENVAPLIDPPDRVEGYLEQLDRLLAGERLIDSGKAAALLNRFTTKAVGARLTDFLWSLQERVER